MSFLCASVCEAIHIGFNVYLWLNRKPHAVQSALHVHVYIHLSVVETLQVCGFLLYYYGICSGNPRSTSVVFYCANYGMCVYTCMGNTGEYLIETATIRSKVKCAVYMPLQNLSRQCFDQFVHIIYYAILTETTEM